MNFRDKICTLCLVKCENCKSIEGNRKIILDMFLPTIEFTGIHEPVMCKNCEEILRKCRDFKATCLHSYDYLIPLLNGKDAVKLDMRDVYLSKNITTTNVSEDQNICGFCMGLVESSNAIAFDVDVEEGDFVLEKMIAQCLPELDLSIIKNPMICSECHRSLENCFVFVRNCLTAEEKIKKYRESLDENSKEQIELSGLLHSTMTTTQAVDVDSDMVHGIKAEKQFSVMVESLEERRIGGAGDDVIKSEQMSRDDNEQFSTKNMYPCAEEGNMLSTIKIEETFSGENETKSEDGGFVGIDDQKFIPNEDIEIKTDDHDFNRIETNVVTQTTVSTRLTRRQKCLKSNFEEELLKPHFKRTLMDEDVTKMTSYQCEIGLLRAKNGKSIKRHLLIRNASSQVTSSETPMYKCNLCSYQTKYGLKKHSIKHKAITMLKCDSCPFQSRWKSTLKIHMLKHMNPSEITMFNCDICSYQTKYKELLRRHLIRHKAPSETTLFKCDSCPFQTKRKGSLVNHMLAHRDPSEVTVFNCSFCSYQTKFKKNLKQHSITHKASSDVIMFKCDICQFQTKYKKNLNQHFLTHKSSAEVTMHNCTFCSFRAKFVSKLKQHSITHEPSSAVIMFKCDSCPYQTSRKDTLKSHVLKHMDPSEATMFNCDLCSFRTKYKKYIKQHLITHKLSSEIATFKCDSCPFQTKRKSSLKSHTLKHMDPTELTMFNCEFCSFQTKYKKSLKQHVVTHNTTSDAKYKKNLQQHLLTRKASSKLTMFKCDSCPFQTKWKHSLKSHVLKHIDTSELMFNCDFCSYKTRYQENWKKHLIKHIQK